jgi:hypothetical protein
MDVSNIIIIWANDKMANVLHLFGFDTTMEEVADVDEKSNSNPSKLEPKFLADNISVIVIISRRY